MVKIIGPALSLDAAGSLGKVFTFQKRTRGNAVYFKSKPGRVTKFVAGYNQYMVKIYTSDGVRHWHLLTTVEKEEWNNFIK